MNACISKYKLREDRDRVYLFGEFEAKFLHISELLEALGPDKVHAPHVKPLGNKLWEIRMKTQPSIVRAIYITATGRRIVVLHAFVKKNQKIPHSAIETALRRKKEADL